MFSLAFPTKSAAINYTYGVDISNTYLFFVLRRVASRGKLYLPFFKTDSFRRANTQRGRYSPIRALQFGQKCCLLCRSEMQNGMRQQPSQQPKITSRTQIIHASAPLLCSIRVTISEWQYGQLH